MLNLSKASGFTSHRAGWAYVIHHLKKYHSKTGIFIDDFIERSFSWDIKEYYSKNRRELPYKWPWIGFLHNPHNMPEWFDKPNSPQVIFNKPVFKESLKYCKAIVVLSKYLRDWVQSQVDIPVIALKHPTELNIPKWSPHNFLSNKEKKVVQVGYWLRNFESFYFLNTRYKKVWLPSYVNGVGFYMSMMNSRSTYHKHEMRDDVEILDYLPNKDYDNLLTCNVSYINLYDSSANNGIIENIARHTPLLINPHPAAIEYLGKDYPLYFESQQEAESKLHNFDIIYAAHIHLKNMDKTEYNVDYFSQKLIKEIYEKSNIYI